MSSVAKNSNGLLLSDGEIVLVTLVALVAVMIIAYGAFTVHQLNKVPSGSYGSYLIGTRAAPLSPPGVSDKDFGVRISLGYTDTKTVNVPSTASVQSTIDTVLNNTTKYPPATTGWRTYAEAFCRAILDMPDVVSFGCSVQVQAYGATAAENTFSTYTRGWITPVPPPVSTA